MFVIDSIYANVDCVKVLILYGFLKKYLKKVDNWRRIYREEIDSYLQLCSYTENNMI